MIDEVSELQLFDLQTDISEKQNVAKQNPKIVERLLKLIEKARSELGDYNKIGKGARFFDKGSKRPESAKWINAAKQK